MVGVQELLRIRVVQFFKRIMRTDPGWKLTTVQHFVAEGVTKSKIYRIIARYRATGTTKHRKGAGRPRRTMTSLARARLRRIANNRTGFSQRVLASLFPAVKLTFARSSSSLGLSEGDA